MAARKGHEKAGGREKGTPNKTTQEIRDKLQAAIEGEMGDIQATLQELKGENKAQYLTLLEKFMAYIIPKKKDITSDGESIAPTINIHEDRTERKAD